MNTSGLSLEILEAAAREIVEQALYYREQSPDTSLEQRWDTAVNQAISSLFSMPERGSRCQFQSPELQSMRWIPISGFPEHIVIYVHLPDERIVRIVHVLHGARNLNAYFKNATE